METGRVFDGRVAVAFCRYDKVQEAELTVVRLALLHPRCIQQVQRMGYGQSGWCAAGLM